MFPLRIFGVTRGEGKKIILFGKRKKSVQYSKYLFKALSRRNFEVLWIYVPGSWLKGFKGFLGYISLKKVIKSFKPDIFIARSVTIGHHFLKGIKALKIAIFPVPFIEQGYNNDFLNTARSFDIFFVNWKDNGELRKLGINAYFLMQGVDPDEYKPYPTPVEEFSSDIAFIGKPYFKERVEFIRDISKEYDLRLYGGDWDRFGFKLSGRKVGPDGFSKICASSKITLGYDIRPDLPLHFSIRLWLTMGCRGFYMTNYVEGMEEIFRNHYHLVWFRDMDEFRDLADFYLKKDSLRRNIAENGYLFAIGNRTYDHVVGDILKVAGIR